VWGKKWADLSLAGEKIPSKGTIGARGRATMRAYDPENNARDHAKKKVGGGQVFPLLRGTVQKKGNGGELPSESLPRA